MSTKKVKLEFEGKTYEFPVIEGSEKEMAFDISKLRDQTTLVTMDNGFANTSNCTSQITFLDGDKGILRYRGLPIEELAEKANFLETAFLLIYGNLPNQDEYDRFENRIKEHLTLPEPLSHLYDHFSKDTHPMAILSAVTNALSAYYPDFLDPSKAPKRDEAIIRLLGLFPTVTAFAYKAIHKEERVMPKKNLDYCSNFLNMMLGTPKKDFKADKEIVDALNLLLILHADHEQNCSTSAVRLVGSSAANVFASISAGICALWGPLHGGANQAVMEMLDEIHKNGGDVQKYVALAKDKTSSFKLMGFGHRVYKNFDPRAKLIKKACDQILQKLNIKNPLLKIAKELEEAALKDNYFVERKLYPNVDFYSGIIYSALNIPVNMFTPMFALGRLPGWLAHWKEMNENTATKIGRPRQIYTGPTLSAFVPFQARNTKKAA